MTQSQFNNELDFITNQMIPDHRYTLADIGAALEKLERRDPQRFARFPYFSQFTVEELYQSTIEQLRGACCDAYAFIHPNDIDGILARLHSRLPKYRGKRSLQPFTDWAVRHVKREASRLQSFHRLRSEYRLYALKGIWRVLLDCTDLGIAQKLTIPTIEAEVWLKVWNELDSFLAPNQRAKPGTRIYAIGRWKARAWKTKQLRLRGIDEQRTELRRKAAETAISKQTLDAIEAKSARYEPDSSAAELLAGRLEDDPKARKSVKGRYVSNNIRRCANCRTKLSGWNRHRVCHSCLDAAGIDYRASQSRTS